RLARRHLTSPIAIHALDHLPSRVLRIYCPAVNGSTAFLPGRTGRPGMNDNRDMIELGLIPLLVLIGTAWFGWASYRRAVQAEQALAEVNAEHRALTHEVRSLERAVAAAEQGLRTLSSHPS